jgi:hypothetical protein
MINGIIHSGQEIVTNGLVLHLDAAQLRSYPTTGTTWTDLSGGGNNGTLTNGPTFNSANGGSIVFDGVNDYIAFTDSNLLPTAGLTLSSWFKTSVGDKWLIDKSAGGVVNGYNLISTSINGIQLTINGRQFSLSNSIITGNWMVITGTWTPSTSMILYMNGSQIGNTSLSVPASINNPSSNLRVAGRSNNTDFWNGNVANTLIYNRALTATEVLQNYNATKSRFGL